MLDQPTRQYNPMSVQDWMITILITFVPLLNFIMFFVWAFSDSTHPSKKNWAKASLLWFLIIFVIYAIIALIFGAAIFSQALNNQ